jgi:hypothetical protein
MNARRFARSMNLPFPADAVFLAALFASASLAGAASDAPSGTAGEPKTHTLFMGADFSIQRGDQYYQVKDVSGSSFVITVNGSSVVIPMQLKATNLRVQSSLKITETSATIADLKGERSYTPEHDPVRKFTKATVDSAFQWSDSAMQADDAAQKVDIAQAQLDRMTGPAGEPSRAPSIAAAQASAILATDTNELIQARTAQIAPEENMGTPLGYDLFDAIEVAFNVSAEKPLTHPFIVMVTRFREKDAPPKIVRNQIYAQSLYPIRPKPTRIHILAGGFPPGYELLGFHVHLYDGGLEVATNVSDKRVPLTRDEAFEYVKLEYIGSHRGETLPARPAMGHLPGDLPARLGSGTFGRTYYVKVSKEGLPDGAFLDDSCTHKAEDPYLQSVIGGFRFKPALKDGTPVNGVAVVKLGELTT